MIPTLHRLLRIATELGNVTPLFVHAFKNNFMESIQNLERKYDDNQDKTRKYKPGRPSKMQLTQIKLVK